MLESNILRQMLVRSSFHAFIIDDINILSTLLL